MHLIYTKLRIMVKAWTKITNGINSEHFTRVLREDPKQKGLFYAGTETGMYISFNDGKNWKPFQLNLPIVPITDLAIKDNNLNCCNTRKKPLDD